MKIDSKSVRNPRPNPQRTAAFAILLTVLAVIASVVEVIRMTLEDHPVAWWTFVAIALSVGLFGFLFRKPLPNTRPEEIVGRSEAFDAKGFLSHERKQP